MRSVLVLTAIIHIAAAELTLLAHDFGFRELLSNLFAQIASCQSASNML